MYGNPTRSEDAAIFRCDVVRPPTLTLCLLKWTRTNFRIVSRDKLRRSIDYCLAELVPNPEKTRFTTRKILLCWPLFWVEKVGIFLVTMKLRKIPIIWTPTWDLREELLLVSDRLRSDLKVSSQIINVETILRKSPGDQK